MVIGIGPFLYSADDPTEIKTGNGFLKLCSSIDRIGTGEISDSDFADLGVCTGYILGFGAGLRLANALTEVQGAAIKKVLYCVPDEVTVGQQIRVVLKYIRERPEKAHFPTSALAAVALKQAFPCPAK